MKGRHGLIQHGLVEWQWNPLRFGFEPYLQTTRLIAGDRMLIDSPGGDIPCYLRSSQGHSFVPDWIVVELTIDNTYHVEESTMPLAEGVRGTIVPRPAKAVVFAVPTGDVIPSYTVVEVTPGRNGHPELLFYRCIAGDPFNLRFDHHHVKHLFDQLCKQECQGIPTLIRDDCGCWQRLQSVDQFMGRLR